MPKCKGKTCGADILWIQTPNGVNTPIDAKPKKRWVRGWGGGGWCLVDCHVPHQETCPNVDDLRKKR